MHFLSLLFWLHCRVCYYLKCSSSPSLSLWKGQTRGQKLFLGQKNFQLMYNHKPKSNAPLRKSHKTADRKGGVGGVNPYGQPDRKISVFFLMTSLNNLCFFCQKYFPFLCRWWWCWTPTTNSTNILPEIFPPFLQMMMMLNSYYKYYKYFARNISPFFADDDDA